LNVVSIWYFDPGPAIVHLIDAARKLDEARPEILLRFGIANGVLDVPRR
jgi:hypothetical protein